jgi:hypothetical protein
METIDKRRSDVARTLEFEEEEEMEEDTEESPLARKNKKQKVATPIRKKVNTRSKYIIYFMMRYGSGRRCKRIEYCRNIMRNDTLRAEFWRHFYRTTLRIGFLKDNFLLI